MFTSPMLAHMIRFYGNAMQGMMGMYLEKNIQAFIDIQEKVKDQSKHLYDGNVFAPEMLTQFLAGQAPMMQSMMGSYMEQSKNMFMQMQEQMQSQTPVDVRQRVLPGRRPARQRRQRHGGRAARREGEEARPVTKPR